MVLGGERPAQRHIQDELRRHRRQRGETVIDLCGDCGDHRTNALLADTTVVDVEVLDTGAQVAHGVRVVPEGHQLLNAVDARLVVLETHTTAGPQRIQMRMRSAGDAVVPRIGRRNDHSRNVVVEQVSEYCDGRTVVLVGPAQIRIDEALDVRRQLDEMLALVSGDESTGFHRLTPELLIAEADVEPVAQHQMSDVTPPGVHAVERVQAHARQTGDVVVDSAVAGGNL